MHIFFSSKSFCLKAVLITKWKYRRWLTMVGIKSVLETFIVIGTKRSNNVSSGSRIRSSTSCRSSPSPGSSRRWQTASKVMPLASPTGEQGRSRGSGSSYPNAKGWRDSKVRCKGSNRINSRGRFICNLRKVGCQQMEGCQWRWICATKGEAMLPGWS